MLSADIYWSRRKQVRIFAPKPAFSVGKTQNSLDKCRPVLYSINIEGGVWKPHSDTDLVKMMKKRSTRTPFIREDGPQAERLSGSAEGFPEGRISRDVRKVALESGG